jgi:hypothetical protein
VHDTEHTLQVCPMSSVGTKPIEQPRHEGHEVVAINVGSDRAGLLCRVEELDDELLEIAGKLEGCAAHIDFRARERLDEIPLGRSLGDEVVDEVEQRGAWIIRSDSPSRVVDELVHAPVDDRLEQRLFGRKVAVERAGSDAGPARDLVERDCQSVLGESHLRHLDQAAAVALRVRAHGSSRRHWASDPVDKRGDVSGMVWISGAMSPTIAGAIVR